MAATRSRWGDAVEAEEEEEFDQELPANQVIGPDAHGIKTVIEYKIKDDGSKVKIIKKFRCRKEVKKLSPAVKERRQWKKFIHLGEGETAANVASATAVSVEEIFLERVRQQSKSEMEKLQDPLQALGSANASLLVCRICGKRGDHWTNKCPYKDLAASKGMTLGEKAPEDDGPGSSAKGGKGGYLPPSLRGGGKGESMGDSMRRPRDENSVRVTNLSEDTRDTDLAELFRPFGQVTRIYVAINHETKESRGFAFVNFANRDDAQRAINKLDGALGYGYDNLILRVEWAAPRDERK